MTIFEWKSEYDTGISEIDNQHKVLVSLINELGDLVGDYFDRKAAAQVFNKLKNYAIFHFATEEGLMAQYHYVESDLNAHLAQHRQFESEFESVERDFDTISVEECNVVLSYLTNWLINHICKVDRRLAAFILLQRQTSIAEPSLVSVSFSETRSSDYLNMTRSHVTAADVMLDQLGQCIDELAQQCDTLILSLPAESLPHLSITASTRCVQSVNLVKSLQSSQRHLKTLIDSIEQSDS